MSRWKNESGLMIEITILFIINCPWINQRITMSKTIRFSQKKSSVLAKANSVQNFKLGNSTVIKPCYIEYIEK